MIITDFGQLGLYVFLLYVATPSLAIILLFYTLVRYKQDPKKYKISLLVTFIFSVVLVLFALLNWEKIDALF